MGWELENGQTSFCDEQSLLVALSEGEIFHISSFCDKNAFTFPVSVVKSFRFPVSLWGGNG